MADEYALTADALPMILSDTYAGDEVVIQIMTIKAISDDKYRIIISDGNHYCQAFLGSTVHDLVKGDQPAIVKFSVTRLTQWSVNEVQGKPIIVILGAEPIGHPDHKIGEPKALEPPGGAANNNAAAATSGATTTNGRGGSNASSTSAARQGNGLQARPGMGNSPPIYPIEGLSPYQNKWTIKARVTVKSDIRHWSNAKGDGKLFSVNLLDDSSEIKATGFNEAVDRLYPVFEEGKVYYISKARVGIAKKQFSNLPNEYEITFERDTEVTLAEDQDSVRQISFDFKEIGNLAELQKDEVCDIIGIVTNTGDITEITTKATQKQLKKRELEVVDRSGYQIRLTLWARAAENWQPQEENGVYAFKGCKVGDFGGRTLSLPGSGVIVPNPDVEEAHMLRGWYDTEGKTMTFQSFSSGVVGEGGLNGAAGFKKEEFKPLQMIVEDPDFGMSDKFDYFSTRATITQIRSDPISYPACPTDRCNKKMTQEGADTWRCDKCNTTYPAPSYRYIMSFAASDYSGQAWISTFNEAGAQIIGISADDLQNLKENDPDAFQAQIQQATGTSWFLNCRAKADSYGDQTRVRYNVQKLSQFDYAAAGHALLEDIRSYGV